LWYKYDGIFQERAVRKTVTVIVPFIIAAAGVIVYFSSQPDIGIGLVIGAYVLYIIPRLMTRRKRPVNSPEQDKEDTEPEADADSWETLREKAIEALERKLRRQKLALGAFFPPSHSEFAALAAVREILAGEAPELTLRICLEALKLRRSPQQTAEILVEMRKGVKSEDMLDGEIERLRASAQP
jgi:hypothetical protein